MPGSSRMPVSLRDGFNHVKKSRQTNPFLILNLDLLRNIVFFFFVVRWTRKTFWKLKGRGLIGSVVEFYATLRRVLYGYFLRAPGVRGQVQKQPAGVGGPSYGLDAEAVLADGDERNVRGAVLETEDEDAGGITGFANGQVFAVAA
ncbi:hypothetical protein BN1723_012761 [Verticillium longisporum]|uniref:Uncharacterized protein n=1 Tax=Verticillium longisporum TaxID=100787 RepID=A0A0G4LM43_VERLO|nr:hypothetical protein BN1723_012761 [Verticillium longisporum]